jgi:hypothetical protein
MPPTNNSTNLYPYKFALLAGLTGSAAAFCAKSGLQQDNKYYKFISNYNNGKYLCWVIRSLLFILWVMTNAKMIEYKIRSFGSIGSSMTVVVAFLSNYVFSLMYEAIFLNIFPGSQQYIGSLFL